MAQTKPLISIVTPCYNEHDNVAECYEAVRSLFERDLPEYDYEHIFGDYKKMFETVERYRAVTAADCKRVAAKYFVPEKRTVAILVPVAADEAAPASN